jgi:hypothetical protein
LLAPTSRYNKVTNCNGNPTIRKNSPHNLYYPQKHDNPNYLIQQSIPQSTTSAKKNEPIMPTSSYYEMRNANDAKYAQIRQRHLDAIVQSIIPSIDNTKTSKVSRYRIRCKMRCKIRCKMRARLDWPEPRTWILRTNLIFQAALGEAKSKVAPLRAALGIRHPGETIFRVT